MHETGARWRGRQATLIQAINNERQITRIGRSSSSASRARVCTLLVIKSRSVWRSLVPDTFWRFFCVCVSCCSTEGEQSCVQILGTDHAHVEQGVLCAFAQAHLTWSIFNCVFIWVATFGGGHFERAAHRNLNRCCARTTPDRQKKPCLPTRPYPNSMYLRFLRIVVWHHKTKSVHGKVRMIFLWIFLLPFFSLSELFFGANLASLAPGPLLAQNSTTFDSGHRSPVTFRSSSAKPYFAECLATLIHFSSQQLLTALVFWCCNFCFSIAKSCCASFEFSSFKVTAVEVESNTKFRILIVSHCFLWQTLANCSFVSTFVVRLEHNSISQ